ncbi:MAG: ComEA family DNA-binding protein [Opitutales bacterium]
MLKKLIAVIAALIVSTAMFAAVNVNTADEAALKGLKGIGEKLAKHIVAERTEHGAFKDFADLSARVKHLSEKKLEKLKAEGLTVEPAPAPAAEATKS